jgi:nitrogen fixation protein NifX
MNKHTLSRELALRIGLAAHALPEMDAKRLLAVIADCVEGAMTESKVAGISLEVFKQADGGALANIADSDLQEALKILHNKGKAQILPTAEAYQDGDMQGSVRIACASDDGIHVDGHFGTCNWFMIYQVSANEARLIGIRNADIPDGLVVDDKNVYRAELIQDCRVLYIASVGGPAAAKIVKLGIHPMRLESVVSLGEVVEQLQTVMAGSPPPWLAKAMGLEANERFRFEEEAVG